MESKKLKEIPTFNNEAEEAEFWDENDSTEFLNWDDAEVKQKTKLISIRLPEDLINEFKEIAKEKDKPYQKIIKNILIEYLDKKEQIRQKEEKDRTIFLFKIMKRWQELTNKEQQKIKPNTKDELTLINEKLNTLFSIFIDLSENENIFTLNKLLTENISKIKK
jgi:predicted DNA binding CopG/RHH family protein